jgi:hypothetical protein
VVRNGEPVTVDLPRVLERHRRAAERLQKAAAMSGFVGAGLLSQYDREDKVPLDGVRRFIAILRQKTGEP